MSYLLCALLITALPALAAPKPKSSLAYQYYSRGSELAAHKKYDEALKNFQLAIDLNPAYVTSYIEYARAAVMLGKRQQGLERLVSALSAAKSRDDRDRVYRERESLSEIFYTNDTFQQYQNGLNYLRLERSSSAVEALERALKAESDNVLVLVAYARALRQEERHKEASAALERALVLNESKREVRIGLAEASLGTAPERTLSLLTPNSTAPLEERVVWLRAQALSELKRNKDAIETVRKAYEEQSGLVYAPLWLGKLYAQETSGAWNARKYLMTFLRRSEEQAHVWKDETSPEARELKAARLEAEQILARVNRSLE